MGTDMGAMSQLLSLQNSARPIFDPLLENNRIINHISYTSIGSDNTGFFASSLPAMEQAMVERGIFPCYEHMNHLINDDINKENCLHNIFCMPLKEDNRLAEDVVKEYGFRGGAFEIIEKKDDCIVVFSFATKKIGEVTRFCLAHLGVLIRFKNYFLDRAKTLLKEMECSKIVMSQQHYHDQYAVYGTNSYGTFDREKFMSACQPKHYYVTHKGHEIEITDIEFRCLKCCGQGRQNKEIAEVVNKTVKTVENYLRLLKEKFSVHSRSQLADIYLSSDLVVL